MSKHNQHSKQQLDTNLEIRGKGNNQEANPTKSYFTTDGCEQQILNKLVMKTNNKVPKM